MSIKNYLPNMDNEKIHLRLTCWILIHVHEDTFSILLSGILISSGTGIFCSVTMHSADIYYLIPGVLLILSAIFCFIFTMNCNQFTKLYTQYIDKTQAVRLREFKNIYDVNKIGRNIVKYFIFSIIFITISFVSLGWLYYTIKPVTKQIIVISENTMFN